MRYLLLFLLSLSTRTLLPGQSSDTHMQWFQDAKLGIFIHWGIYAVDGIDESWSFFNKYLSYEDYMKQTTGFTAEKYQPKAWVDLIEKSGARYAVLTTKHHDGVALWDTKAGELNVVKQTPAQRDLVGPFVEEMRTKNLKVGLYYSLSDWSHPDYPLHRSQEYRYQPKDDPARWARFLSFQRQQLRELSTQYKPDLYWFDGDWEHDAATWKSEELRKELKAALPNVILNSRLAGYGDYATPENGVPILPPDNPYWELCLTMNDSWGYQPNDHTYKSVNQIIRIFADCLSMGGNLLLDIGPKADGTIPEEQVAILEGLGRWTKKHQEAIYGTRAGLPTGHFYGPTTLSADSQTLYLFVPHRPNGPLVIKGLKNKVNRIRVVGQATKLSHEIFSKYYWSEVPGLLYIDVPAYTQAEEVTVIAVQLKGKVALHR
ncbi:MAG: alpha-L-fucosidase [Bacteroidota bacterium]